MRILQKWYHHPNYPSPIPPHPVAHNFSINCLKWQQFRLQTISSDIFQILGKRYNIAYKP